MKRVLIADIYYSKFFKDSFLYLKSMEGMKCSLLMNFNELKSIVTKTFFNYLKTLKNYFSFTQINLIKEINYRLTPRHNNYIYKSKEESNWVLYQVVFENFKKNKCSLE